MNDLSALTMSWLRAKADEAEANTRRGEIESQMIALLPAESTEGTVSQAVGDYKVAVSYKVTRKVDSDKLREMWDALPAKAQEAFKWSAAVTLPKLRALAEYMPADYAKLSAVIESKPAKPSVSIELAQKAAA